MVIFFVYLKLLFRFVVTMRDLAHGVEAIVHLSLLLQTSGNLSSNMSDAWETILRYTPETILRYTP